MIDKQKKANWILKGDKQFFDFVIHIGLDVCLILTPKLDILMEMGKHNIKDYSFIKLAIKELNKQLQDEDED